jgi:hypothetical protein
LRRGPKHPDMIAIANRHAFISSSDGSPSFFYSSDGYWGRIRVMELDQSEDEAEGRLADWSDGEEVSVQIIEMTGRELLPLICSFDALVIGEQEFAVTWDGRHFVDQEPATLAEIVAALPVAASE